MSIQEKIDNDIAEIDTRIQRISNELKKLEKMPSANRLQFQNHLKEQISMIKTKVNELKNNTKKLEPQFRDFYKNEIKNLFERHSQLLSEFERIGSLQIQEDPQPQQLSPTEPKTEKIIKNLDDTYHNQFEMVTRKIEKDLRKIEGKLSHAENDLQRLDFCLPSQKLIFQNEIKMQIDVIQSKINKVVNSARQLPPEIASEYNNKTNLLVEQLQKISSKFTEKVATETNGVQVMQIEDVPVERAVNIESINDIIEPDQEVNEKKCFNPCMKNYIIWPFVAVLCVFLGFSIFWKLRK